MKLSVINDLHSFYPGREASNRRSTATAGTSSATHSIVTTVTERVVTRPSHDAASPVKIAVVAGRPPARQTSSTTATPFTVHGQQVRAVPSHRSVTSSSSSTPRCNAPRQGARRRLSWLPASDPFWNEHCRIASKTRRTARPFNINFHP